MDVLCCAPCDILYAACHASWCRPRAYCCRPRSVPDSGRAPEWRPAMSTRRVATQARQHECVLAVAFERHPDPHQLATRFPDRPHPANQCLHHTHTNSHAHARMLDHAQCAHRDASFRPAHTCTPRSTSLRHIRSVLDGDPPSSSLRLPHGVHLRAWGAAYSTACEPATRRRPRRSRRRRTSSRRLVSIHPMSRAVCRMAHAACARNESTGQARLRSAPRQPTRTTGAKRAATGSIPVH